VRPWLDEHIFAEQRLPLFLCFLSFVVTFVITRVITRMIRAGRGPFKDNVSASGLHVHHAVPGIILLVLGALISVSVVSERPWNEIAAVMIGIGTALVLDEFALILHMSDVYWSEEGRISVEMVSLSVAGMGMFLVGFSPFEFSGEPGDNATIASAVVGALFHLSLVVVCVVKGKYGMALLGAFVPVVAFVAAIRLARPDSLWARRRYTAGRADKAGRTQVREARYHQRYGRFTTALGYLVAGRPSDELASAEPSR
jgi:hypothetical protein